MRRRLASATRGPDMDWNAGRDEQLDRRRPRPHRAVEPQRAAAPSGRLETKPGTAQSSGVSLPKAGGAIKGLGEKFSVSAATGTASLATPAAQRREAHARTEAGQRFRLRQRAVRFRLEPRPAGHHAQDRQRPAALLRRRRVGRVHPVRLGRPCPDPRRYRDAPDPQAHGVRRRLPDLVLSPTHRRAVRTHRTLAGREDRRQSLAQLLAQQRRHTVWL